MGEPPNQGSRERRMAQKLQQVSSPKWQCVEEDALSDTDKLRIPGGWLYRHRQYHPGATPGSDQTGPLAAMSIVFVPESEDQTMRRLLRNWAAISKALGLTKRNSEIADYDDEIASMLTVTAEQTLAWRDRPE